jgi:glyoxylase-like metal-dependent hydrolase (beta-lactamase superfamily II)/rhodanese-related sulfurtransferase
MVFEQILHEDLGCASYLIIDQGEAAVVDPKWQIGEYLDKAAAAGAEIRHVLETHNHADHVSGRRRLAAVTGAELHLPSESGVGDGYLVRVGGLELLAIATPGHRPEHVSYLVREDGVTRALIAGDSLLVGDVARPDLAVEAQEGAAALWGTVHRLLELDDSVELYPAHVGGSLCLSSNNASSETFSTVGHERVTNERLTARDVETFTAELTAQLPVRPPSVAKVVAINVEGAAEPPLLPLLTAAELEPLLAGGLCVLDIREPDEFDRGHLEGSLNLCARISAFGTRGDWVSGGDEQIVIAADSVEAGREAAELLRAAGVWNLAGLTVVDLDGWRAAGLPIGEGQAVGAEWVLARLKVGTVTLVDVRDPHEWEAGHVAGAVSLPLPQLADGLDPGVEIKPPVAVVCAAGLRAALAASVLRRRGYSPVWRVTDGIARLLEGEPGASQDSGQAAPAAGSL